ncbi:MAG: hypothetical protein KAJ03_01665 [Gammaproteobacteria bacterium]|nr:hypothetical protein [Gammaproteobacteria bacterium]
MMYNEMDAEQRERVQTYAGIMKNDCIVGGLTPDEMTAACILMLAHVNILREDTQK